MCATASLPLVVLRMVSGIEFTSGDMLEEVDMAMVEVIEDNGIVISKVSAAIQCNPGGYSRKFQDR